MSVEKDSAIGAFVASMVSELDAQKEIADWITKNVDKIFEISEKSVEQISKLRETNPDDWKEKCEMSLFIDSK